MLNAAIQGTMSSRLSIPVGIIALLNGSSVPTEWTTFSSANDKMIMGAGSTYAVGATAAGDFSPSLGSLGGSTTASGDHAGTDHGILSDHYSLNTNTGWTASGNAGDHSHTMDNVALTATSRSLFKLVKSTAKQREFPANISLFSTGSLSGLTNVRDTDLIVCGGSTNTDHTTKSGTVALGTAGEHIHDTGGSYDGGYIADSSGSFYELASGGDHNDSIALQAAEIELRLKRLLLSVWTNASSSFKTASNMIAMWESLTPPDGWWLCNGSNGTPDLRDHGIESVSSGSENTTSQGDNKIRITMDRSISHSVNHDHYSNNLNSYSFTSCNRSAYDWSHNHTLTKTTDLSWLPPYYALAFIMKK